MPGRFESYEAANQSPPYEDVDLFASDQPLRDAVAANGNTADANALAAFGRRWGAAEMFALGRQANEHLPDLNLREYATLVPLILFAFWIGIYPKPFFDAAKAPVDRIVMRFNPGYYSAPPASAVASPAAPAVEVK